MEHYYKDRFKAQQRLNKKIASLMEVNEIIENVRDELRQIISSAMEVCILLLDHDAGQYTRPLQCALYKRPVNCQACKRDRPAIQKAIRDKKMVMVSKSDPVIRLDNSMLMVGPEVAMPIFVDNDILAVISVVAQPGARFQERDLYLISDYAERLNSILLNAKRQWEITREKISISRKLSHLAPFVPESVRTIVDKNPEMLSMVKKKKQISVLFLDLEGYTRLSANRPDTQVNEMIERMFSSFVDPIHRSHGDINETAGDALMIIFKNHDSKTNAINSVKAAFEISQKNRVINQSLKHVFEPIHVNIGINSGTALVGMSRFKGSLGTRMTYTASGPVTNLASRLADYATGGDIVVGEETERLIKGIWPVFAHEGVMLKGLDSPQNVYSLLRQQKGDETLEKNTP